jgi:Big-like domain-containing protein
MAGFAGIGASDSMCHLLKRVWLAALVLFMGACNLQIGTPTPPPTPDAPQIEFQAPLSGATISENTELDIALIARDAGVGVAKIELLIDDQPYKEVMPTTSAAVPIFTVTMNWLASGVGLHSMTATAFRPDGTASQPFTIIVEVTPKQPTDQQGN